MSLHCLLAFTSHIINCSFEYVSFFSGYFKNFLLSLVLSIYLYCSWEFFLCFYPIWDSLSFLYLWWSFISFGKLSLQIFIFPILSLLFFQDCNHTFVRLLAVFFFFFLTFLFLPMLQFEEFILSCLGIH